MDGATGRRDVGFHLARIALIVVVLLATAWPISALRRAGSVLDRGGVAASWTALVGVSLAAVLLMLTTRRRSQPRLLQAAEAVLAVVLSTYPSGLLGFPPGPRWLSIALLGPSVQPLATAWLAIVLTRPANRRVGGPISDQPTDTIADR